MVSVVFHSVFPDRGDHLLPGFSLVGLEAGESLARLAPARQLEIRAVAPR